MFPYSIAICLLTCICLYDFLGIKSELTGINRAHSILFILNAIFLYFLAAFRFETGRDWQNYIRYFNECASSLVLVGGDVVGFEPGFAKLNQFFKIYTNDFYAMQVVIISFSTLVIFRNIYKTSGFPLFSLLMYVLLFYFKTDMAQTRQHIAMAILICGRRFWIEKKLFPWVLVVITAMMFHISALVAFPLYFTSRIIIKNKMSVCLFCFAVFVTYFGSSFVSIMLFLIGKLPFIPARIAFLLIRYTERLAVARFSSSGLGILGRYAFIALIVLIYVFKKDKKQTFFFFNFLIAVIFNAMGQNFQEFSRIANYYFICGGGLYSYNLLIDSKIFFKKIDCIRYFVCVSFIVFNLLTFYKDWFQIDNMKSSFHLDYTPYKSFLFGK